MNNPDAMTLPSLDSDHAGVARAWRIALGDLAGNIQSFQDGLLDTPQPVLLAGLDYDTPWTRDAAINTWNGLGLLWPDVTIHTLLSVLEKHGEQPYIGGQYWDSIIWTIGAWHYYLHSGDREFLTLAADAAANSLERLRQEEFDPTYGLFRGPAVYGDGVSAYPDLYSPGSTSSILDWVKANPTQRATHGFGLPMMTLSTNLVYAETYRVIQAIWSELGKPISSRYAQQARALRAQIQGNFWNPALQTFRYLVGPGGPCDFQEGLGHAFALLFDLVDGDQARSLLDMQHLSPVGIPCVWPTFPRYQMLGGYGRHSGTVWPFISGFWGEAALKYDRPDLFVQEFTSFTTQINRHAQCAEIYHPETGDIYGGLQECGGGHDGMLWESCARQSWTASAYLRLVLCGLCGLSFTTERVNFHPYLPEGLSRLELSGLVYRQARLELTIKGQGGRIKEFRRNGATCEPFLPAQIVGKQSIEIILGG